MPRSQRTRSARALANDAAIREAAIAEVLAVGVDHLSLRDVGRRAGLTHGATYARYEDVDELLVDLWMAVLCERVRALFECCERAARQPGAESVGAMLDAVRDARDADVAALRVLLTARRIPTLYEEVEPFITDCLDRHADADDDAVAALRARTIALFSMMALQILGRRDLGAEDDLRAGLEKSLLAALETDPQEVTEVSVPQFVEPFALPDSEDLRTQLSLATFKVVGKSGYTQATISRIARRAHCSPGAIYKLYPSKEDLVIAAFNDLVRARWLQISNFLDLLEEGSLSGLLGDVSDPKNAVRTQFVLEATLAGAHLPRLQATVLHQIAEMNNAIDHVEGIGEPERRRLHHVFECITFLTIGVAFFSTVTPTVSRARFNEFAEPLRRSLWLDGVPAWDEMRARLRDAVVGRTGEN